MVGPLLGIPDELLPTTRTSSRVHRCDNRVRTITVGDAARELAANLLGLGHGVAGVFELPLIFSYRLATAGLLPDSIRESYGLRWTLAHQALFDTGTRASRVIRPIIPPVISQWSAARRHRHRRKLSITESKLIRMVGNPPPRDLEPFNVADAESEPTCIAVDWSGARTGSERRIWLAEVRAGDLVRLENGRSAADLARQAD